MEIGDSYKSRVSEVRGLYSANIREANRRIIRGIGTCDELQQVRGPWSPLFSGQSSVADRLRETGNCRHFLSTLFSASAANHRRILPRVIP